MPDDIYQPSPAEKHALVEASAAMEDHGVDIGLPWEGDLDDREKELYRGLVTASRNYSKNFIAWWMMQNGLTTGHGDTLEDMLAELVAQARADKP